MISTDFDDFIDVHVRELALEASGAALKYLEGSWELLELS